MLGVEVAHFFDEVDEWLEFLVFFGEDEGGVYGGGGEAAGEDCEDLDADVETDVFLGFDCAGAQVGSCDYFGVLCELFCW